MQRDPEAWKKEPATYQQLYTLKRAGVSFRPDITKGIAAELIARIKKSQGGLTKQ